MSQTFSKPGLTRRLAAFLLPTLPAGVAIAAYAHGHGSLSGRGLGVLVLLAILAGTIAAVKLLGRAGQAQDAGVAALAKIPASYRS